jgi:hypothetical protein
MYFLTYVPIDICAILTIGVQFKSMNVQQESSMGMKKPRPD